MKTVLGMNERVYIFAENDTDKTIIERIYNRKPEMHARDDCTAMVIRFKEEAEAGLRGGKCGVPSDSGMDCG